MTGSPTLSIVIPAYNEERRLGPTLERLRAFAVSRKRPLEVLVVDDGSRDATLKVAAAHDGAELHVRTLENGRNRGKGYSLRAGVLAATAPRILVTDADLSTPIDELDKLEPFLDEGYDIVIASRDQPDSRLEPPQPLNRRIMGTAFREMRRMILLPELRDTQCGFKLLSRKVVDSVFSEQLTEGFAFDCEILARASKLGFRIKEVGVVWRNDRDSRVKPVRDAADMLWNIVKIRWRLR